MSIFIKLTKEQKSEIVRNVQMYYEVERSEAIGELAADQIIDFMMKELGPHIYNHAIEEAKKLITDRMFAIKDELFSLIKPIGNRK